MYVSNVRFNIPLQKSILRLNQHLKNRHFKTDFIWIRLKALHLTEDWTLIGALKV